MIEAISKSAALHAAVARYEVGISRMQPTRRTEAVASNLTYRQAKDMQEHLDKRLAGEEPALVNCMCRSLAVIKLMNGGEVARVLGYGPGFSLEAAVKSVESFLRDERLRLEEAEDVAQSNLVGLQEVADVFEAACL